MRRNRPTGLRPQLPSAFLPRPVEERLLARVASESGRDGVTWLLRLLERGYAGPLDAGSEPRDGAGPWKLTRHAAGAARARVAAVVAAEFGGKLDLGVVVVRVAGDGRGFTLAMA